MKPKIGDTVQFKKSGIIGTVEKILRGACIVDTHGSKLSAWPEDLIICGLSEESLDNDMKEHQRMCDEIMAIQGIEPIEAEDEHIVHCPEGYQFVDENGNIINATKIVLEKKKKEYPKTYEECCEILGGVTAACWSGYKCGVLGSLNKLLICRDAYWKIVGDEMGLGKPWEPDYDSLKTKYTIVVVENKVVKLHTLSHNHILTFPTEEMQDAFKENFDPDIEFCKELL